MILDVFWMMNNIYNKVDSKNYLYHCLKFYYIIYNYDNYKTLENLKTELLEEQKK